MLLSSFALTPLQIAKIFTQIKIAAGTALALDFYKAAEFYNSISPEDRYAGDGRGLGDLVRIDIFVDSVKTYIVHVEFDALGKNAMFFRCDISADSDIVIQEVAL